MDDADRAQQGEELQRENSITGVRLRAAIDRWPQGPIQRDCLDCEDPIPEDRLRAVPGAQRCTRCQEIHEHALRTLEG